MTFELVQNRHQSDQIIALQAENHVSIVTPEQQVKDGFVTVRHDPDVLWDMNQAMPSAIALDGDRLAAYCLAMPREFVSRIPILEPMFARLDELTWADAPLRDTPNWFVMGQTCVGADYRGQGVFDGTYNHLRLAYQTDYQCVITEIADSNQRSLRAHYRVGFETLLTYNNPHTRALWHIVVWDWR
jgi:hypothetical protein